MDEMYLGAAFCDLAMLLCYFFLFVLVLYYLPDIDKYYRILTDVTECYQEQFCDR